jgi:superfamily II DNA or RNA helicase
VFVGVSVARLRFDRGTLLVEGVPETVDLADIPGVLWDPRVRAWRAPARVFYALAAELRRRGVPLTDRPLPRLRPPSAFRPIDLRPYQQAALAAWRLAGRRGILVMPTGSGKTHVALAAIAATPTPALCLVPTRALMAQWAAALRASHQGPVCCFGDGERAVGPVTVATFASAYRHMATLGDHFGLLVVDEVHHFGGGLFDEALEMSIAPVRLGLTGTPPPPGPARDRLATLVGRVVVQIGLEELAGRYLARFERITWHLDLDPDERREYQQLRELYRAALRAFSGGNLDARWEDFLRHASRSDEGRVGVAAWRRARRLLAYPRCKQQALAVLLQRHRQQRTLVFVADNSTAYAVARQHLIPPLTCDIGRAERTRVLEAFRAGTLRALVSAQVLNEGLDVPEAEVGIIVGARFGEREHTQRVGRLLRPGEAKVALVYELVVRRTSEVATVQRRWEGLASRRRSAA